MIVYEPAGNDEMVSVATPFVTVPVPITVLPFVNSTVPVAPLGATVAVSVNFVGVNGESSQVTQNIHN